MINSKQTLLQTLRDDGQTVHELRDANGGSLLVMQRGGRILGLYTHDERDSLLWVNPNLYQPEKAHATLNDPWWPNTGGDRIWLGPEVDLNMTPEGQYAAPRPLDPGQYSSSASDQQIRLDLSATVALYRSGAQCDVQLERHIGFVPNPLRYEKGLADALTHVRYVGYEQTTTLTLAQSSDDAAQVGLWDIVQLPTPGRMIVPTLGHPNANAPWMPLIGDAAPSVTASSHGIEIEMGAKSSFKLGVRTVNSIGRAGYVRPREDGQHMLVVRNFAINPSGDYVDVPPDPAASADFGYAFQCYNDNGNLGQFGELEYHAPAVSVRNPRHTDISQLWAFEGEAGAIQHISDALLG